MTGEIKFTVSRSPTSDVWSLLREPLDRHTTTMAIAGTPHASKLHTCGRTWMTSCANRQHWSNHFSQQHPSLLLALALLCCRIVSPSFRHTTSAFSSPNPPLKKHGGNHSLSHSQQRERDRMHSIISECIQSLIFECNRARNQACWQQCLSQPMRLHMVPAPPGREAKARMPMLS